MRIAVVGAGVSGCVAARLLASEHEVTLFSADSHAGGHAQTVDVELDGATHAVDVAFMVFNERTYPFFCRLLDLLGVESRQSDMSFSVTCPTSGVEYQGGSLRGLFAQKTNLLSPAFLRMLVDVARFNRIGRRAASEGSIAEGQNVREFLAEHRFGRRFAEQYLAPMAAAIWSSNPREVLDFPAKFLLGFFANHGLLQLADRPQWRTIVGGSRRYVEPLLRDLGDRVRCCEPVEAIRRTADDVELTTAAGGVERYDQVVLACHADQTLAMLKDSSQDEAELLAALPYQKNQAVLHTDESLLPCRRAAWASWNYRLGRRPSDPSIVTYDLSRLQGLPTRRPLLLTLNGRDLVDPGRVLKEFSFSHPAFTPQSIAAQGRWDVVSGRNRTHYCGAYWGNGFHEDGVRSALAVTQQFGIGIEACTAACTRAPSRTAVAAP
ncbi:hypothetical protein Mal64_32200 [Pseudobythopirellula maris]|uniref:Amine oxidase domain-containing protein n=1 Tax=Pseudobythopirellula maris TaxID=2527991 RepID=A0A5C5ZKJ2_9BACT|nr:FAD-dependent oxidoreductase [Pseudobythopirellula maris]TWT87678.1 hypothetical protein Mal64_32200 [Pseudobythopirellula maris]